MSLQDWQEASKVEIDKLLDTEPNITDTPLLGALMVIANYEINVPKIINPQIDYVPNSRIDELMNESLQHFIDYMKNKTLFQQTRIDTYDSHACEALKKMLITDENISLLLYQVADEEEKFLIEQSYEKIINDINHKFKKH